MAYCPPPAGPGPRGALLLFGWVLWVTEHQQWQNLELAWSQLLRVTLVRVFFG